MKAIILSAGQGKRLFPLTKNLPKCLVEIKGLPILEWQLQVLLGCGVDEIVVVTGFQHEKIDELVRKRYPLGNIRTLYNPDYSKSDNLVSCWKSRGEMDRDFILLNGDTLFEPAVLERLLSKAKSQITLTVSTKNRYDADDMKVIMDGSMLRRVGKDLPLEQVNGESIGLSLYTGQGPETFSHALNEAVRQAGAEKRWYLSVIDKLAQKGLVGVVDVTGLSWCEIDFPTDLKTAEQVVEVIGRRLNEGGYVKEVCGAADRKAGTM